MNSIVVSPFWQSVDEQWIGTVLIAISVMILVSTALFILRSRSLSVFLVAAGLIVFSAMLLAPIADSQSPRMFQRWLMSPAILSTLSALQLIYVAITVFGSIRQEYCSDRKGKLLHEIRSWLIAAVAVLPSPVLLVFIFWVEQNMMISTRQTVPMVIGAQVAGTLVVALILFLIVLYLSVRHRAMAAHLFVGLFLLLSGALLPCLTIRLSFTPTSDASLYVPGLIPLVLLLAALFLSVGAGVYVARRKQRLSQSH